MAGVSRPAPNLRVLGATLRTYRLAKGLTQERLSFASGMTTALISDTENGKRNLSFESLERWLAAVDVTRTLSASISRPQRQATALGAVIANNRVPRVLARLFDS